MTERYHAQSMIALVLGLSLAVLASGQQTAPLSILVIGAHPDDADSCAGARSCSLRKRGLYRFDVPHPRS